MRLVFFDCECFYDRKSGYSLSSMTTEAFIRDPRFSLHGAAIKWDRITSAQWYDERELRYILKEEDWSDVFLVSHHAQWDHGVLGMLYNIHPKMSGCTLSMSRLMFGNHLSVSLESVRKYFNLTPKTTPYSQFEGKHWNEMPPQIQQALAEGCIDEVESKAIIFKGLLQQHRFPLEELEVIDCVIKMFTNPCLVGDRELLAKVWQAEAEKKDQRLELLGVTAEELQSSERFAELLRAEGIEPETKISPKGNEIYAFAKNDDFMRDTLKEHENWRVRLLAEARLGEKSTLLQTRAATLGWMASRGPMPVYLRYSGAATLRFSGGDGANWQNFKRGSDIRRAICAPEGFLLAPIDLSQVECRVLAYLSGQQDQLEQFRTGADPYVDIASKFYGRPITKKDAAERGTGKQAILSCLGPDTLVLTDTGYKPITTVELSDRVWDGIEWVNHSGVVLRGERPVVDIAGLCVTSDHLILCGNTWQTAQNLQDENILFRALESGSENLPLPAMNWEKRADSSSLSFSARVALQSIRSFQKICMRGKQRAVINAPRAQLDTGPKNITATQISALMTRIVADYLDASRQFLTDAVKILSTMLMPITADEAFEFSARGGKIRKSSWHICSRCLAGTTLNFQLTASKTIKDIVQAIFNLQPQKCKLPIGEKCEISNKKLPTYDIVCAGPRNRFTIACSAGHLIVHNCGYGSGGPKFKATAKLGIYGPPVELTNEEAAGFVKLYRDTHGEVVKYWRACEWVLGEMMNHRTFEWGPLRVVCNAHKETKRVYFPNGACIIYDTLMWRQPTGDEAREGRRAGYYIQTRNGWKSIYGSMMAQHMCEAVSRLIMTQAMLRIKARRLRPVNSTHDELLVLIPKDGNEEKNLQLCIDEMTREPDWLPGIPLAAEGGLSNRYEK